MRGLKIFALSRSIQMVASGEVSPYGGEWETVGFGRSRCVVSKGEPLPLFCGTVVLWRLLQEG